MPDPSSWVWELPSHLSHNPFLQGWEKVKENVFPVSLLSCASPCWSHARKNYCFTSWLKRVYNVDTFQSLQLPHCTSVKSIFMISVDLNRISSAYFGRQCQVHTQCFQQKIFCTVRSIVISVLPRENTMYSNYLQPLPSALASSKVLLGSIVKCCWGQLSWGGAAQL